MALLITVTKQPQKAETAQGMSLRKQEECFSIPFPLREVNVITYTMVELDGLVCLEEGEPVDSTVQFMGIKPLQEVHLSLAELQVFGQLKWIKFLLNEETAMQ